MEDKASEINSFRIILNFQSIVQLNAAFHGISIRFVFLFKCYDLLMIPTIYLLI